ncbi:WD repeat-containing protein 91-like isoform X3 [Carex littledalei]|uniref:WD repeat-containing protein 91-like isoform X3 n=1 Tax=Carex littledalei TaxID=544730 RepID=A0A833R159_9POAL|nr:WD repeat-containing protein 91-like isoform X3 [Carex littledalei]
MRYAEELVREFLIFRGFTTTLQSFESELSTEIGRNFDVDKILDLIFSLYIPKFQPDKLLSLLNFFKQCLTSPSETALLSALSKLELSVLRYYVVYALKSSRPDKVSEFFGLNGNYLLEKRDDWLPWFVSNASLRIIEAEIFFIISLEREKKKLVRIIVLTFIASLSIFLNIPRLPSLLKISTEKITVNRLKNDIKQLNNRLSELQALLEAKEAEISGLKSLPPTVLGEEKIIKDLSINDHHRKSSTSVPETKDLNESSDTSNVLSEPGSCSTQSALRDEPFQDSSCNITQAGSQQELMREEDFSEVKVNFQETFLGHTSPISRCRFSASGANIASASLDGTVRLWTYDSSSPSSRNATIYCGTEIMSLDWECRSDRLLLIGTADGGIKAWNADAKRVVADLSTSKEYPSVLDMKCSPVEPIFVSAAASKRRGSTILDRAGFASLTVWNMKLLKPVTVLPLGEDPPAITSLCFNHNGKILAAAATDGMIHMFDMSAGLQITGWPAHDTAVSSVKFGPAETSIFSLGSDGNIFEWSLHNQGQILWSRDCNKFCNQESLDKCRHEIALDADGKRLLVTSGLVRAPIYEVQGQMSGMKTLPHSAAITSVDWHPTLDMFITGSADHSVRVTSII